MTHSNYIDILNDIENKVSEMSNDELETLSKETEETFQAVLNEIQKRSENQRHDDVDHLENHFSNANLSFKSVKDFIAMAIKELKN